MKTEDVIFALTECSVEKGATAAELAKKLGLSRSNVSGKLNELVKQGKAIKRKGKPVYYSVVPKYVACPCLDSFQQQNPSLQSAIAQSRSAVLYPPHGMNLLLTGETGVGKSMFAEMLHHYAIESGQLCNNAPFIIFNCADYASNPQLLLAWLFGVQKGAYTGATEDRKGLLEQADGGTLFLDEVHRLPPEGQEMFFTFVDKGIWRRVGDAATEYRAQVRILAATTELPQSALLTTFRRRFPVIITLPALNERSLEERFSLIKRFFNDEARHLARRIRVSANSLRALLSYPCTHNIGQLQADIRFACATSWAEFCSEAGTEILVKSRMLPEQVRLALFTCTDHRQAWNHIVGVNSKEFIFSGRGDDEIAEDFPTRTIFELIQMRIAELKSLGIEKPLSEKIIRNEIADFFARYMHNYSESYYVAALKRSVPGKILRLTKELIDYAEVQLQNKFSPRLYYGLANHLRQAVERASNNQGILCPGLNAIRKSNRELFSVALDCLQMTERVMAITLPVDEAGFLSLLFLSALEEKTEQNYVRVFVVAHGNNTATELVNTACELLGVNHAVAFNAPLNSPVQTVLERIIAYIHACKKPADIMLLVDMGSLTAFAQAIEARCGVSVATFQLASTLHVIEAVQSAMQGNPLPVVYQDVQQVTPLLSTITTEAEVTFSPVRYPVIGRRLAVVTLCTTGERTAHFVRDMLFPSLSWRKNLTDIIPLDIPQCADIAAHLQTLSLQYHVIAVISPFPTEGDIPWFTLADIIQGEGIAALCKLIDSESIWLVVSGTLEHAVKNLSAPELVDEIRRFYQQVSADFSLSLSANMLIGLIMHLACLFDRLKAGVSDAKAEVQPEGPFDYAMEIKILRRTIGHAEMRFGITVSDNNLRGILRFWQERPKNVRSIQPAPHK